MEQEIAAESLLGILKQVPDPRRREGRVYPLWSTIGMLVLGALNGQTSLRGMWLWGCRHWRQIGRPLGFTGQRRPPSYGAVRYLLIQLDPAILAAAFQQWVISWSEDQTERISLDGKVLRGSRRREGAEPALAVVTAAAHQVKLVLGQQQVQADNYGAAAVQLLRELPLKDKIVTMDAGLLRRQVARTIVETGGDYLGPLKDNEVAVKQAVEEWLTAQLFPPGAVTTG